MYHRTDMMEREPVKLPTESLFNPSMVTQRATLIQETQALKRFCQTLSFDQDFPPFLTLDTEFIRERTYYPILCLIQVADARQAVAIDPLAPGLDLTPFWEVLEREDILKVFHASRQDLEIFRNVRGVIPQPLFDTQLAAMVCGFGESVAYETLVRDILNQSLDKTSRFSDWSARPLREEQLAYALGDVTHLRGVYRWFAKELNRNQRGAWLEDELSLLLKPETYELNPADLWKRVKSRQVNSLNAASQAVLRELCIWREEWAKKRNLPRRHVIKDDLLVELAILKPTCVQDLKRLRDPKGQDVLSSLSLPGLFEIICRLKSSPLTGTIDAVGKPKLSSQQMLLLDVLKLLLRYCAQQAGVAPKLLASAADLECLIKQDHPDIPALHGWRYDLFGQQALAFKEGKQGLVCVKGKLKLTDFS